MAAAVALVVAAHASSGLWRHTEAPTAGAAKGCPRIVCRFGNGCQLPCDPRPRGDGSCPLYSCNRANCLNWNYHPTGFTEKCRQALFWTTEAPSRFPAVPPTQEPEPQPRPSANPTLEPRPATAAPSTPPPPSGAPSRSPTGSLVGGVRIRQEESAAERVASGSGSGVVIGSASGAGGLVLLGVVLFVRRRLNRRNAIVQDPLQQPHSPRLGGTPTSNVDAATDAAVGDNMLRKCEMAEPAATPGPSESHSPASGSGPVFYDRNQPRRGSGSEQGTAEQHTCEPTTMEPFTLEHNSVANSNDPGGRGCSFERDPPTCNRSSQDMDDNDRGGALAVPGSLSCSPQPRGPRDPEHPADDACGAAASDSPPFDGAQWEFDPVRKGAGVAQGDSPPFDGAEWEFDPVRKGAGAAPGSVNHSPQHVHPRGESGGRAASGSPMLPQEDVCINMPLPAAAAAAAAGGEPADEDSDEFLPEDADTSGSLGDAAQVNPLQ